MYQDLFARSPRGPRSTLSESTITEGILDVRIPTGVEGNLPALLDDADDVEQRWRMAFSMRSLLLGLLVAQCAVVVFLLNPINFCNEPMPRFAYAAVALFLIGLPGLMWLANWRCHRMQVQMHRAKLGLACLLVLFYGGIVAFDIATHVMDHQPQKGHACHGKTMIHLAYCQELVDFTFHFFVMACMLTDWRSRMLLIVGTMALWAVDDATYPQYSSSEVPAMQRGWNWAMWVLSTASLMFTALAVTVAAERLQRAQIERARLKLRVIQIEAEKERLIWDARLHAHGARSTDPPELKPAFENSDGASGSHFTTKLSPGTPYLALGSTPSSVCRSA
jgi:hypothetical protein